MDPRGHLDIPLLNVMGEDVRYWMFDSRGKYSVREGYKLETGFYDPPRHSSEHRLKYWWKRIWNLAIPPKIRIFLWRAMHDIITTQVNLVKHHVPVNEFCYSCNLKQDSTCHALFWCPVSKQYWKNTILSPLLKQLRNMNMIDIFIRLNDELSQLELETVVMSLWAIWNEQQRRIHKNGQGHLLETIELSEARLREFQEARNSFRKCKIKNPNTIKHRWIRPQQHQMKLEVDAAVNQNQGTYTIGGAVRNHEGKVLLAFGKKIAKLPSFVYAELVSIKEWLILVKEHNISIQEI